MGGKFLYFYYVIRKCSCVAVDQYFLLVISSFSSSWWLLALKFYGLLPLIKSQFLSEKKNNNYVWILVTHQWGNQHSALLFLQVFVLRNCRYVRWSCNHGLLKLTCSFWSKEKVVLILYDVELYSNQICFEVLRACKAFEIVIMALVKPLFLWWFFFLEECRGRSANQYVNDQEK